jgi:hypothetical protein
VGFDILSSIRNGFFPKSSAGKNTALGLQDFYQTAAARGFARDFHFRVTQIGDSQLNNEDLIYVRSASVPSREIITDNVHFRGFSYQIPMTVKYPDAAGWNIEFIMDKDYGIYKKLDDWHKKVFDPTSYVGIEVPGYDQTIELVLIDDNLSVIRKFYLRGIFPVKLGELKYNMGGTGAPVSFTMTIAFQYMTDEAQAIGSVPKSLLDNIIGGLAKVTGVAQSVQNIVRGIRSI